MGFNEKAQWRVREVNDRFPLELSYETMFNGTIEDVRREIDEENARNRQFGGKTVQFAIMRHRSYTLYDEEGRLVANGTSSSVVEYYPKKEGE